MDISHKKHNALQKRITTPDTKLRKSEQQILLAKIFHKWKQQAHEQKPKENGNEKQEQINPEIKKKR